MEKYLPDRKLCGLKLQATATAKDWYEYENGPSRTISKYVAISKMARQKKKRNTYILMAENLPLK